MHKTSKRFILSLAVLLGLSAFAVSFDNSNKAMAKPIEAKVCTPVGGGKACISYESN